MCIMGALTAVASWAFFVKEIHHPALLICTVLFPILFCTTLLFRLFSVFSTVAIMGLALGIAALLGVLSATGGMQKEIQKKLTEVQGDLFAPIEDNSPLLVGEIKKTIPPISAVSPVLFYEMLISTETAPTTFALIKGIDSHLAPETATLRSALSSRLSMLEEKIAPQDNPAVRLPVAFLGAALARQLHLQPGKTFRITSPQAYFQHSPTTSSGAEVSTEQKPLSAQEFFLADTIHTGTYEIDSRVVLISLSYAQRLVGSKQKISGLEIFLQDPSALAMVQANVERITKKKCYSWKELNKNLYTSLSIQRAILSSILFLIVIVASFNVVASLTMMVADKTKEIAILKSMGMSASRCARIFRMIGIQIGVAGTATGLLLGKWLCTVVKHHPLPIDAKIYKIDHLPIQWSWREALIVCFLGIVVCFVSTLYPARRAAKCSPVDGLRHE